MEVLSRFFSLLMTEFTYRYEHNENIILLSVVYIGVKVDRITLELKS